MDIHSQLNKNMQDIVNLFQSRMEHFDRSLEETAAKSSTSPASSELSRLAAEYFAFKKIVWDSLALLKNQVQLLETAIDSQETRSRQKVLLIHGLEEDDGEIPRPMLVRFNSLKIRHNIWSSKTNLKGSGYSLSEFLTKTRQEIFVAARKHFGIRNCWSSDGIINVILPDKSKKRIVTMHEFHALTAKFPLSSSIDTKSIKTRKAKNVAKK